MDDLGVEEKAFVVDEVNNVVQEVRYLIKSIEQTIQNAAYHHNKVSQWNSNIVEQALKKLTGMGKPFKYVVTCTIMQKNGAGLHCASSCYWDNASDGTLADTGSATYKYDAKTMNIIVNVFGLAI